MIHVSVPLAAVMHRFYMRSEQASMDFCNEVVDGAGRKLYLDKVGSVSAMVEVEADVAYDPDHALMNAGFQRRLLMSLDGG